MRPWVLPTPTPQVEAVKISEVGCLGYRENKCSLKEYWDRKTASGPWEPFSKEIV